MKSASGSRMLPFVILDKKVPFLPKLALRLFFFLIGIHPMQGSTTTTRHGVTRKKAQKRLQDTKNLFRKNLQLKDVC